MKKLLLLVSLVFSIHSCQAQFHDVEPREPVIIDFVGTVKHTSETGSLIQGERLSFQVDVPLEIDVEYRCILEVPHHWDREKVTNAILKGYRITPTQAWKDIIKMFDDHAMPNPVKR